MPNDDKVYEQREVRVPLGRGSMDELVEVLGECFAQVRAGFRVHSVVIVYERPVRALPRRRGAATLGEEGTPQ